MRRNARQHRTESRSIQRSVQILLTVCGIVFLLAGLVLAASGASVSSAVGSVSDRLDDVQQPADDGGDTADSNSVGDGDTTDGTGGTANETEETDSTDSTDTQTDGTDSTDTQTDGTDSTDTQADSSDSTDTQADGTDSTNSDGSNETTTDKSHVLTAVVESQNGDVIDNATVTVDPGSASNVSKSVDENGETEFVLEDGEYAVTADADGYKTTEKSVQVDGADQTITLTLEQQTQAGDGTDDSDGTHTLAVTVKDENGTAVENATVEVAEVTLLGSSKVKGKAVDDDGVATFELEDGEYTVSADADGYTFTEQTVTIDGGDESITLTLASKDG